MNPESTNARLHALEEQVEALQVQVAELQLDASIFQVLNYENPLGKRIERLEKRIAAGQ